jgi:hypothetical protein
MNLKTMNLKSLILASLIAVAVPAAAHDVEKGPHGGRMADAGSYHVELVAKDNTVDVFLTGADDKPVSATGFKGTAILVVDGKAQRIVLEATGAKLTGKAGVPLPAQPKGAVQLTAPDGKTASAKF